MPGAPAGDIFATAASWLTPLPCKPEGSAWCYPEGDRGSGKWGGGAPILRDVHQRRYLQEPTHCEPWRLKTENIQTSLVVQWLRLRTSTAEGTSLILGQGTGIPQAVWCDQKKKKNRQELLGSADQMCRTKSRKQTGTLIPRWGTWVSVLPNTHVQAHSQVNNYSYTHVSPMYQALGQYLIPITWFHSFDKSSLSTNSVLVISNDQNAPNFLLSWK